jgi:hypothetical protein
MQLAEAAAGGGKLQRVTAAATATATATAKNDLLLEDNSWQPKKTS